MRKLALSLAIAGCGSAPPPRPPVERAVEVLPAVPFAELDREQRVELMKAHVLPTLTPIFQRHDPQKFTVVECKTCHAENDWRMPNPELPVLSLDDLGEFEARDVEWMKSEIIPAMRSVLRDPELRCGRCHPLREN